MIPVGLRGAEQAFVWSPVSSWTGLLSGAIRLCKDMENAVAHIEGAGKIPLVVDVSQMELVGSWFRD